MTNSGYKRGCGMRSLERWDLALSEPAESSSPEGSLPALLALKSELLSGHNINAELRLHWPSALNENV